MRARLTQSASLSLFCGLVGCGAAAPSFDLADAPESDAAMAPDLARQPDSTDTPDAAHPADAALAWSMYTIDVGSHVARTDFASTDRPIEFLTAIAGRDYELRLNPSAAYVLTSPTEPNDQLDWNKLPGFSDCATLDLATNGAMFGWRWRPDRTPPVLELSAYANNDDQHLSTAPLVSLDLADLMSDEPLRYRVWADGPVYHFSVHGQVRTRAIDVDASLPRQCPTFDIHAWKWASSLYFGGTSTAPSQVTAHVAERAFVP